MAKKNIHWARSLSDAVNLASTVAAAVALGYFVGKWLDGKFDTEPWLTIVGFLLGVATGIKAMWEKAMSNGRPPLSESDSNKNTEKED